MYYECGCKCKCVVVGAAVFTCIGTDNSLEFVVARRARQGPESFSLHSLVLTKSFQQPLHKVDE